MMMMMMICQRLMTKIMMTRTTIMMMMIMITMTMITMNSQVEKGDVLLLGVCPRRLQPIILELTS